MKKVKILITHDNEDVKETIRDRIKDLDYVEVVSYASNGQETLDAVVKYKPNIVFTKYDTTDIPMLNLIKKAKQVLKNDIPIFKFISEDLLEKNELVDYDAPERNATDSIRVIGINGILTTLNSYNEIILGQ